MKEQSTLLILCTTVFCCTQLSAQNNSLVGKKELDTSIIHAMETVIENQTYPNTHSVLISIHNKPVYEKYWTGIDRTVGFDLGIVKHGVDSLHTIQSVTKSFVSACVGIALQQGKIKSIEQKMFDFFPEYAAQDTGLKAQITVKDLLTMTAGFDWNEEDYNRIGNPEHVMDSASDPVGYVLSLPLKDVPGTVFTYTSGETQLLAAIVEKATGKTIDAFAKEYLFNPLGITNYEWTSCSNSNVIDAFAGLYMRSRDMMKFGLLYMNDGKWNSKQIVPALWVKQSTTPQINTHDKYNDDYGFQWWLWTDTIAKKPVSIFAGLGGGGQTIFIDKRNDLVVVITAGNYRKQTYSYDIMRDFVYPALFKK
jgi:CubicO group peptidase (beta-lactamase class C family)